MLNKFNETKDTKTKFFFIDLDQVNFRLPMPIVKRRKFLKQNFLILLSLTVNGYLSSICFSNGLTSEFNNLSFSETLNKIFKQSILQKTDDIILSLPEVAENGAVVPLKITSQLTNIERIFILVEKNPTPFIAEFELSTNIMLYITTRIKMAESSRVIVVAQQGNTFLTTDQWVNVTLGGCGTG